MEQPQVAALSTERLVARLTQVRAVLALWLLGACLAANAAPLLIVTDPWAPYAYTEDGQPAGMDLEVTTQVFERMGVQVQWEFVPWRRALAMVEQGRADGVLDIFWTAARDSDLLYPGEPLSDAQFVLYQANARPHTFSHLDDLKGLKIGVVAGYDYGTAFMQHPGFERESAATEAANFGKLLLGRLDLLVTDRRTGAYAVRRQGLQRQVSPLPGSISERPQYLALRRAPGMQALAERFSDELRRFKREPAYTALLDRYGNLGSPQ